jgi:paraquat-inducible protein B
MAWLIDQMNPLLDNLNIGDFASIISLLITILVFYNVRKIRQHYRSTARIALFIDRLERHILELARYLKDFENSQEEIEVELATSKATLKSATEWVEGPTKSSITQILSRIDRYLHTNRANKEFLKKIFIEMVTVNGEVKNLQETQKWEQ